MYRTMTLCEKMVHLPYIVLDMNSVLLMWICELYKYNIPRRNDEVANLTQELKQLKETNESGLGYFCISGNPGSGKSQLTGLVAEQIFKESTDAFVMTLNAANLDRLLGYDAVFHGPAEQVQLDQEHFPPMNNGQ